jgi:hypothetical protein
VGEEGVRGGGAHVGEERAEKKEKGKGAREATKENIRVSERWNITEGLPDQIMEGLPDQTRCDSKSCLMIFSVRFGKRR